jgi:RNA-binding protein
LTFQSGGDFLRHIGTILHISPHGKLIVQGNSNFLPKLKNRVYTRDKKIVGSVIDVFGPVKQPYLSITVSNSSIAEEILSSEKNLYVREKRKRNK